MKKWQIAIASLLLAVTAGCQQNNQPAEEGRDNDNHNTKYMEVKQSVNDNDAQKRERITSQDIARHLVKIATGVPQVKDATAVVTMGYAVVGIDVDKDVERSKVGTIKYAVAEAMRNDRYGANAVVVADPDTVERLKNMGQAIKNGRPVSGVLDQLADIVGRVIPQVPSDMRNTNQNKPSPGQQQKQQLPKNENRELQKQQKKQAKPGQDKQVPNLNNQRRNPKGRSEMNKSTPNMNNPDQRPNDSNNQQQNH
ncbi:MAG TPA: YhcN/YlaJ family sporulation lipoprotein [Bacillales bacterium]